MPIGDIAPVCFADHYQLASRPIPVEAGDKGVLVGGEDCGEAAQSFGKPRETKPVNKKIGHPSITKGVGS